MKTSTPPPRPPRWAWTEMSWSPVMYYAYKAIEVSPCIRRRRASRKNHKPALPPPPPRHPLPSRIQLWLRATTQKHPPPIATTPHSPHHLRRRRRLPRKPLKPSNIPRNRVLAPPSPVPAPRRPHPAACPTFKPGPRTSAVPPPPRDPCKWFAWIRCRAAVTSRRKFNWSACVNKSSRQTINFWIATPCSPSPWEWLTSRLLSYFLIVFVYSFFFIFILLFFFVFYFFIFFFFLFLFLFFLLLILILLLLLFARNHNINRSTWLRYLIWSLPANAVTCWPLAVNRL